jgi:hypothetical protein
VNFSESLGVALTPKLVAFFFMKQEGWGPYWIYILNIRTARKPKRVPQ